MTCAACGKALTGRQTKFCSRRCNNATVKYGGWATSRICMKCGERNRKPHGRTCDECETQRLYLKGLAANYQRRARLKAVTYEPVNRVAIFERDGWTCQLCNKRIDRRTKHPHPRAATLDHIIPLSCGGNHEPANVQCAHSLCNARKGTRAADEQLRLIG